MQENSRVKKSLLNARVNMITYALVLLVTFFSRKLFLEKLGDDFIGMTSTLSNLLGLLNLAELGIAGAIGYLLYKPLVSEDTDQINKIMSVFGFIYRRIGFFIAGCAIILGAFLPMIMRDAPFALPLIYFAYASYAVAALLSYFANYKQVILASDQSQYVVTGYYQGANIARILIQILVLYYTSNPYYWVGIEISFSFIYSLVLNNRIDKAYPWLRPGIKNGRHLIKQYPEILKYTKQIFVHKVGGLVLYNLSPVFIFAYTTLSMVTMYSNYQLIATKVQQLVSQLLGSADSGIGLMIAENDQPRIRKVFHELLALRYLVAGIVCVPLLLTTAPFISLWLGDSYILPISTLIIIVINTFIMITRPVVDAFNAGYGLFYDTWAPLTEAGLNIGCSMLGGMLWGLNGVLLGTTVSMFFIIMLWKPYFLFSKGFKRSVWHFWRVVLPYYAMIGVTYFLIRYILSFVGTEVYSDSFLGWGLYALVVVSMCAVILYAMMYSMDKGMRMFSQRLLVLVKDKIRK